MKSIEIPYLVESFLPSESLHPNASDLTNRRFGKLLVICDSGQRKGDGIVWKCICDCGKEKLARSYYLKKSITKSCGCIVSPSNEIYHQNLQKKIRKNSIIQGECWIWTGRERVGGYGESSYRKDKHFPAHRLSFIAFKKPIPKSEWVLHICDNRKCVNPDHIYLGNQEKNTQDMLDRNRSSKGENRPLAKLTDEKVYFLRILFKNGIKTKFLSDIFKISHSNARDIAQGRKWKHITA